MRNISWMDVGGVKTIRERVIWQFANEAVLVLSS